MTNLVVSWIRTFTPVLVGGLIAWLVRQGVKVDTSVAQPLTEALTVIFTAVYYFLVRTLETWWPGFGWLLGIPKQPAYPPAEVTAGNRPGGAHSSPGRM